MARPHVPKFGNWESGDNVPYTIYFDKAREGRNTGKIINPNDPQENPELFSKFTPQPTQPKPKPKPKPTPPKLLTDLEEPIIRRPVRPSHGEVKHFSESPGRNKSAFGDGCGASSARPVRQSVGSENSIDRSPLHQGKSSYESGYGTPERAGRRPTNRGRETPDRGAAVPKFGAWENDPSSATGYTHIFNKVREEKHSDSIKSPKRIYEPSYPPRHNYDDDEMKSCCFPWGRK